MPALLRTGRDEMSGVHRSECPGILEASNKRGFLMSEQTTPFPFQDRPIQLALHETMD